MIVSAAVAMRSHAASRGRRGTTEGVTAETGTKDLKIVLQPEGGVKGKVMISDGSPCRMIYCNSTVSCSK